MQVRGLIARRRSGLLDHLLAVRWRDRGALPARERTKPTANGISGWHRQAVGEASLGRRTARPGRARPSVQLAGTHLLRAGRQHRHRHRMPRHDRGLASSGRTGRVRVDGDHRYLGVRVLKRPRGTHLNHVPPQAPECGDGPDPLAALSVCHQGDPAVRPGCWKVARARLPLTQQGPVTADRPMEGR